MPAAVFMRVKRSLEKRSASRQIHRSLHATGNCGRASLLPATAFALTFAAATLLHSEVNAAPTMRMETTSEPGDWVGGGAPRRYTEQTGTLFVNTTDRSTPGRVDFAEFSLQPSPPDYNKWFLLMVGTRQLGHELRVGRYTNVERASFATSGHAGLDVSQDGAGCNTISGSFEITNVVISSAGILQQLDMTFEQRCENGTGLLRGRFAYDASGAPISFDSAAIGVPTQSRELALLMQFLLITAAVLQLSKTRRKPARSHADRSIEATR